MKFALLIAFIPVLSWAQEVPLPMPKYQTQKMTMTDLQFVAGVFSSAKLHPAMDCEIKVREIRQNRKFSTGFKWVEMLEVKFKGYYVDSGEKTVYFPVGGNIKKRMTENTRAGVVEEIVLTAKDSLENELLLQHDGAGQISHLVLQDLNRVYPCKRKY